MAEPIDPNTPEGRQIASDLTKMFAQFRINIANRKRQARAEKRQERDAA